MIQLIALVALYALSLFGIGRAAGSRGTSPAALASTVGHGARALAHLGSSHRPVEHLRG